MGSMSRFIFCGLILCWGTVVLARGPASKQTAATPGGNRRVTWTTSRMVGSPNPPPPYKVEPAFAQLKFTRPVLITNAPGSRRLFVAEQTGKIYSFANDPNSDTLELVVDLKKVRPELGSIYGLAFHPDFERNRFVYVCYVVGNNPDGSRVVRFEMRPADPPQIDAESERVVITWPAGGHNGGCLKFGPDGYLYITTGDGSGPSPPDTQRAGQDVSNLLSSILRIDVDRIEASQAYRVPPDNPLVDVDGARPEIWSYGYRNPWKMSFDRGTGDLWVGDVGWELWEMIYRVEKGGNYGWSIMEGRQPVHPEEKRGPTPILPPTIDHPHSEAASITGGFVYHGRRLKQLIGAYIYGDFQTGIVWGARFDGDKITWHQELAHTPLQLVGFGEDNGGELYLLDYRQQIYRLVENPQKDNSRNFPRKLSQTGLFSSVQNHLPAPGVIPYSINAEQWADDTQAQRWLAVPDTGQINIDAKGNWKFPDGSVLAKTVSLQFERGVDGSARRLETQIFHREAGSWRPYCYVWNDQQTDATLVDAKGFTRALTIRDSQAPGKVHERMHRFAGRAECVLCHNPWVEAKTTIFGVQSASLLAVNVSQLNRDHIDGDQVTNQLQTFRHIGLLDSKLPGPVEKNSRLVNPYDETADLNQRARAYLHVNCWHCHQFNAGGAATIALSHNVKLKDARMLGVRPTQGTFGITNARIVVPGDPLGSVLYYRIAKLGGGRMPRVGSSEVDERAVTMIYDWIAQLSPAESKQPSGDGSSGLRAENAAALEVVRNHKSAKVRAEAIQSLTSSTRGALALLRLVDRGRLPEPVRHQIVSLTKGHETGEVRDLFERFVPVSERIKRLGAVVNQTEILNLQADVDRGKQVFFNNTAAACKSCHRIKEIGETLGPDLTQIGKKYQRQQLLQHILEPSKFMEPKYVPYLLETTKGLVLSGLLEKQTDDEVILKDTKNKLHRVAAEDVELLVRRQKSLMPDLLLRDMTRQQVADLLSYLASLK